MATDDSYKKKLGRILGISGWSKDRMADLLEVSNNSFNAWVRGDSEPKVERGLKIDEIYDELVRPLLCKIEDVTDKIEKRLLEEQIGRLRDDNICEK